VHGTLLSTLRAALTEVRADGLAIGAAVGELAELACRGSLGTRPVDAGTVFYGASVTKQLMGVLLARAVVEGAAAADDPVRRWLPDLPDWTAPIRLRHLIHHTSGLPDAADPALGVPGSNAEVIDRLRRAPPERLLPGAGYAYNNAGYVLLAEALAQILGRPIAEAAANGLFAPLALSDTRLGGRAVSLQQPDPPRTVGDGGLWTSISDLTRWLQACNKEAFGAAVHRLAETPTRLGDGSPVDYAWGVRVTPAPYGRVITHGGSWPDWLAKTVRVPERQVAVAILSVGAEERAVSDTGLRLAQILASRWG
jgi:CubicO group peptidase (beta-lactamase class C family)